MARRERATSVQIPTEPIHVVINGVPKIVDPHDLVLSSAEKEELSHNRASAQNQRLIHDLVRAIYDNAARFAFDTLMGMMPESAQQAETRGPADAWLDANGFEVQQDALTTVIRMRVDGNMRVVRTMTASVEAQYESDVVEWIRRDAKQAGPLKIKGNA